MGTDQQTLTGDTADTGGDRPDTFRPIVLSPPVLQYACSMAKTSVSIPDWMIDEIFRRRQKGENRSEWIRAAIQARFDAEDVGDWVEPELEPPTDATVEADD